MKSIAIRTTCAVAGLGCLLPAMFLMGCQKKEAVSTPSAPITPVTSQIPTSPTTTTPPVVPPVAPPTTPAPDSTVQNNASQSAPIPDGWETYSPSEGGFSVAMPGKPTETTQTQPTDAGPTTVHIGTVDKGDTAYFVSYNDYDTGKITSDNANAALDKGVGGIVNSLGGTVLDSRNITINGNPGRDVKATMVQGSTKGTAYFRTCLVKNRLYQVMVLIQDGAADGADKVTFLESFKLL